jgi:hypothetical protein
MEERNRELQRGRDQLLVQLHDLRFQVGVRVDGWAGGRAGGWAGGWGGRLVLAELGEPLGWRCVGGGPAIHPPACHATPHADMCMQLPSACLPACLPACSWSRRGTCGASCQQLMSGSGAWAPAGACTCTLAPSPQPPANLLLPLIGRSD